MNGVWRVFYDKAVKYDIDFKKYHILYNPLLKAITLENDDAFIVFTEKEIVVANSCSKNAREKRLRELQRVS